MSFQLLLSARSYFHNPVFIHWLAWSWLSLAEFHQSFQQFQHKLTDLSPHHRTHFLNYFRPSWGVPTSSGSLCSSQQLRPRQPPQLHREQSFRPQELHHHQTSSHHQVIRDIIQKQHWAGTTIVPGPSWISFSSLMVVVCKLCLHQLYFIISDPASHPWFWDNLLRVDQLSQTTLMMSCWWRTRTTGTSRRGWPGTPTVTSARSGTGTPRPRTWWCIFMLGDTR